MAKKATNRGDDSPHETESPNGYGVRDAYEELASVARVELKLHKYVVPCNKIRAPTKRFVDAVGDNEVKRHAIIVEESTAEGTTYDAAAKKTLSCDLGGRSIDQQRHTTPNSLKDEWEALGELLSEDWICLAMYGDDYMEWKEEARKSMERWRDECSRILRESYSLNCYGCQILIEVAEKRVDQLTPDELREMMRAAQQLSATHDETAKEDQKGIALHDVAFQIEEDEAVAKQSVKRWSDSKRIKAKPIGKCPLDGRRLLYRLSELLPDMTDILGLNAEEVDKYRQALRAKLRTPRDT